MTDPDRPSPDQSAADQSAGDHPADDHPERADGLADLDALVGTVLDGEATPDERARVEGDPTLRARLTELQAVRTALVADSAPPRLSEEARDRLLATALAAARDPDDRVSVERDSGDGSDVATVPVPLSRARSTRRTGWLVGAAAATIALVVALAIVVTARPSNESSDSLASSAGSAGSANDTATPNDRATPNDEAAPPSTTITPAPGSAERSDAGPANSLPNLGTYPDIAALAAATRGVTRDAAADLPLSAVVSCPDELDRADLTGATAFARALVAGQAVVVGRATTNHVAIVESTCAVLPLP